MERALSGIPGRMLTLSGRLIAGKVVMFCLGFFALLLFAVPAEAISTAPKQFWFGEEHGSWTFADVFHDKARDRANAPANSRLGGQDPSGFVIDIETPGAREGALLRGTGTRADCPWSPMKRKSIASACEGI
ncbi:MAG: hypothetical protein HS130_04070 [Deltaproteobacteria bacterium]|nr:hypothetical protein [Deltaproteobacteria bacterium]MCL4873784.1 hypothetical protein [bacterium]